MDHVYLNRPSICEVLRGTIKAYKKNHPRLNSSQIARKFGVSTSSFNRIENGDIVNPSIDQSIRLLSGCGTNEDVADFLRTYYPQVHEHLHLYFVNSVEKRDTDFEGFFNDESTYEMMMLASTSTGLTEDYVLKEYGKHGHKIFMKIAAKGVVQNIDGKFYTSNKDVLLSSKTAARVGELTFKSISEAYTSGINSKASFNILYESVNMDKVGDQLRNLTEDYAHEMKKILKDPKNIGTTLVSTGSFIKRIEE